MSLLNLVKRNRVSSNAGIVNKNKNHISAMAQE